jgi:hypothetical protein
MLACPLTTALAAHSQAVLLTVGTLLAIAVLVRGRVLLDRTKEAFSPDESPNGAAENSQG